MSTLSIDRRNRRAIPILMLVVVIAAVRTATTWHVFSATLDEPVHIAAGFDWWRGDLRTDPTHPPLARLLSALPLVSLGVPGSARPDYLQRGNDLLYHDDRYVWHLTLARGANLLFLALSIVVVALWTARAAGLPAGILAATLFSLLPPVLGHAGMATTDLAAAATWGLAMFALERFLSDPSRRRGLMLGAAVGLGVLSKFSFIPFFVIGAVVACLVLPRPRAWKRPALAGVVVAVLVVWGGYRFGVGTITASGPTGRTVVDRLAPAPVKGIALWIADHVRIPAPNFFVGFGSVALHNRDGHAAYLLGECDEYGWWYYFPVALFYKTPLAWLFFAVVGAIAVLGTAWRLAEARFLLYAIALLAFTCSTSINVGVRHVLPLYLPLAALAGHGVLRGWQETKQTVFGRGSLFALCAWILMATTVAHPDHLAYFNEAAAGRPERILVDSNLDWGQDILRLERFVEERQIRDLTVLILFSADLPRHRLQVNWLEPHAQPRGWIAVSATSLALQNCKTDGYRWLRHRRPVHKIGQSINLYYIQ